MSREQFFEHEGSRVLTSNAFGFVLDGELRRAVRSQNFLTLVVLETRREWEGLEVTADDGTVDAVAQVVGRHFKAFPLTPRLEDDQGQEVLRADGPLELAVEDELECMGGQQP